MMMDNTPFTRRMFDLPVIEEGERYPHLSKLPHCETVREALRRLQVTGWCLCRMIYPQIFFRLSDNDLPPYSMLNESPLPIEYKLRFLFLLKKSAIRKFVKGGFIYDSMEQLESWQRGD